MQNGLDQHCHRLLSAEVASRWAMVFEGPHIELDVTKLV